LLPFGCPSTPASKARISIPGKAANNKLTADISEVRPPTHSNMGNCANHAPQYLLKTILLPGRVIALPARFRIDLLAHTPSPLGAKVIVAFMADYALVNFIFNLPYRTAGCLSV